ncbi:rod shape-determining protein MreC [Thermoactinospora rubra]|uniref:rod shape-determining protein MreC n=1 Tax=Thermoactinospora rubra TaxID=1088767 RepID=UPI000A10F336|nr:rod shape-determining protein MreC [Thermoactinospora rubra]
MRPARRHRAVLLALVALSAALVTVDVRGGASALREWGAAVVGPVQRLIAAGRADEGQEQAVRLAAAQWAGQAGSRHEAQRQAIRAAWPDLPLALGQVIAVGARGDTVAVDVGTKDGVRADQMVLTGDGLVGRVVEAGHSVSTVRLAADPASSLGVRLAGSREIGIVTGQGLRQGLLRLRLLAADARIEAGQRVETLGSARNGPYLPGVPVGTVVRVEPMKDPLVRTALVRPAVRFSALDVVGVVTGPAGGRDEG